MPIREFFHFMHIVDDFDAAEARYGELLSPEVYAPKHWSEFDKRWASLAVVGPDFVLEIMEPSKAEADLGSPLPKFRARHGEHLHSLSWFVDQEDLAPLARRMAAQGIRVVDPYGAVSGEGGASAQAFFTHPKDTFGQLEFQGLDPEGGYHERDPHLSPDWSGARWRDEHPLGLERSSHYTTIVSDLERAKRFYEELLGAQLFHEETGPDRRSAFAFVGTESVVELAQPTDPDSRLGRDLAEHGELPHAITFKVRDLDAAARHIEAIGLRVLERTDDTVTIDPDDMFQAVVAFTTRRLPNDPRG